MSFINRIKRLFPSPWSNSYYIGVSNLSCQKGIDWYSSIRWIDCEEYKRDGWFADPFILDVDEKYISILAEQWYKTLNRGRLVKMTVRSQDMRLIDVVPILTLDTHLSFPNIWREDGLVWVYPENYQGGSLRIWRYDLKKHKLCNPHVLLKEPLLDAQMCKIDGEYYVFSIRAEGEKADNSKLHIYKGHSLDTTFEHIQTIENTFKEERGAGAIIKLTDGRLLRPAQSCEGGYGKCVIMYELLFDGKKFQEKELFRIKPNTSHPYSEVLHTYNEYAGLTVIDGNGYDHPFLHRLMALFRR